MKTAIHLGQVIGVNLVATTFTYTDFEDWLKILGLILATVYTSIKIWKEIKITNYNDK